jgi:hypothetical protein
MSWTLQKINNGGNTSGPAAVQVPFASLYNSQQHIATARGIFGIHGTTLRVTTGTSRRSTMVVTLRALAHLKARLSESYTVSSTSRT